MSIIIKNKTITKVTAVSLCDLGVAVMAKAQQVPGIKRYALIMYICRCKLYNVMYFTGAPVTVDTGVVVAP